MTDSIKAMLRMGADQADTSALAAVIVGQPLELRDTAILDGQKPAHINPRQWARLQAAVELGKRYIYDAAQKTTPRVQGPMDVYDLLAPVVGNLQQEQFWVLCLDARNFVVSQRAVTTGLVDRTQVHAREVFRGAILDNCARIIVAHNHPSGDPTPSPQDIECTRNLVQAGKVIGIDVLDHIVIGRRAEHRNVPFISFRESNLL